MAWPNNLDHVRCIGFDKKYLPALKHALDAKIIEWGNCDLFMELRIGRFKFAGCEWDFTEMAELVESFRLVNGEITAEDLTAAVLRGYTRGS